MIASSPVLRIRTWMVLEWAYRYAERCALLCEDRAPSPEKQLMAEADANQWLAGELAQHEVDAELPL